MCIRDSYKGVPDLPDPAVTRFGRVDVFGQGPVNGVCPPPAVPTQCATDGYVSRHAFGSRLRADLRSGFLGEISWVPTWGGTYNNQRDRSAIQLFIGQRF